MNWPTSEDLEQWEAESILHAIDHLQLHRAIRQERHREHVIKMARWLGREVGAGRLAVERADHRLDVLLDALDPESVIDGEPVGWDSPGVTRLLPIDEGRCVAKASFLEGLEAGYRELRGAIT